MLYLPWFGGLIVVCRDACGGGVPGWR